MSRNQLPDGVSHVEGRNQHPFTVGQSEALTRTCSCWSWLPAGLTCKCLTLSCGKNMSAPRASLNVTLPETERLRFARTQISDSGSQQPVHSSLGSMEKNLVSRVKGLVSGGKSEKVGSSVISAAPVSGTSGAREQDSLSRQTGSGAIIEGNLHSGTRKSPLPQRVVRRLGAKDAHVDDRWSHLRDVVFGNNATKESRSG